LTNAIPFLPVYLYNQEAGPIERFTVGDLTGGWKMTGSGQMAGFFGS